MYTIEQITGAFAKKLCSFQQANYAVNIFGIRHPDMAANSFNDTLGVFAFKPEGPLVFTAPGTTDAGIFWRLNPADPRGTAVLPPGHYPKLWKFGMHQGKYPALTQNSPVAVWRDGNKDKKLDKGNLQKPELIGLNFHHAGENSTQVDNWSATCQVVAKMADWNTFWSIFQEQKTKIKVETFDYTLFEQSDITS